MSQSPNRFSHFDNTRPRHANWTIIGVTDSVESPGVRTVEIYQGDTPGECTEPKLVLDPEDVPQFVAGADCDRHAGRPDH